MKEFLSMKLESVHACAGLLKEGERRENNVFKWPFMEIL